MDKLFCCGEVLWLEVDDLLLSLSLSLSTDTVNFLGISIVGQTSEDGAGGIFVGSVMKG